MKLKSFKDDFYLPSHSEKVDYSQTSEADSCISSSHGWSPARTRTRTREEEGSAGNNSIYGTCGHDFQGKMLHAHL